jgi:hypothetical protein
MGSEDGQRKNTSGEDAVTADRWLEVMLVVVCVLTVVWIGFTLWLAGEVLGLL